MGHAQKPDFVFRRNGRVHLNRRGRQFSRLLAAEVCASAVVMLDTPCSEVQCKSTGYPLHSHVSPSLPLSCVTVCHQVSTELYKWTINPPPLPSQLQKQQNNGHQQFCTRLTLNPTYNSTVNISHIGYKKPHQKHCKPYWILNAHNHPVEQYRFLA